MPAAVAAAALALAAGSPVATGALGAPGDPLCGRGPLEILLTNDDGHRAAGIRALRGALVAAGHRVTLAAPDYNASGSAMSFNWGTVRVTRDPSDPAAFAIGGTPATSVVLAATALYPAGRRPDLVISGINHGSNAGALLALSGTVGAALAGTLLLDPPVPGIAVNAVRLRPGEPADSEANRAQLEAVAAETARLLVVLRGWYCDDGRVTRGRSVLNVNFPGRAVAELRSPVVARQGSSSDLRVVFGPDGSDGYRAQVGERAAADVRGTDVEALAEGHVTVTPLTGALGDDAAPRRDLQRRLRALAR